MARANLLVLRSDNNPGLSTMSGSLGRAARAVAARGVNIEAFSADASGLRLLCSDTTRAANGLRSAGFDPEVFECFEVMVGNRPGELARLGEELAKRGVTILESFGLASPGGGRVFLRVDDLAKAAQTLERARVMLAPA
jgi:hypothetical protein